MSTAGDLVARIDLLDVTLTQALASRPQYTVQSTPVGQTDGAPSANVYRDGQWVAWVQWATPSSVLVCLDPAYKVMQTVTVKPSTPGALSPAKAIAAAGAAVLLALLEAAA